MRKLFVLLLICCLFLTSCGKSKDTEKGKDKVSKKDDTSSVESVNDSSDSSSETSSDDSNDDSNEDSSNTSSDDFDYTYEEDYEQDFEDEYQEEENDYFDDSEDDYSSDTSTESDSNDKENSYEETAPTVIIEKPYTENMAHKIDPRTGGADSEAESKRKEIINTEDKLKITGTKYYISPTGSNYKDGTSPDEAWQNTQALLLNGYKIQPGDAVLFERGGVYRATSAIIGKTGVTYGAYGEGPKPCIYGSAKNYADDESWTASKKKYVWKIKLPLEDAGIVVINNGEICERKKSGLLTLRKNGDFYHNVEDGLLYLYCDKGYPDQVYESIEIGVKRPIMCFNGYSHDITVDNLCFKYTGGHAISGYNDNYNITITNCEIGWAGGSEMKKGVYYGNGIQFWSNCHDILVDNCWVYQVYDAGLTFQGGAGSVFKNITFSNNLIQYCNYSIEIFAQESKGTLENILISDNIMQFAGCGFTIERPSRNDASHICGWSYDYGDTVKDFVIKGNIFDVSDLNLINWTFTKPIGISVSGNTFYQKPTVNNYALAYGKNTLTADDQTKFEEAIKKFDSAPKLVKWLSE